MDVASLDQRYASASPETRRLVIRLLDQDADDRAWADEIGPVYRQGDVADLLGKSRQAVSGDRRLLRLEMRSGAIGYPAFQFDGRRQTPGLGTIVELLSPVVETSWTIASWLTSPQPGLAGARPLDLLRAGQAVDAEAAARQLAAGLGG